MASRSSPSSQPNPDLSPTLSVKRPSRKQARRDALFLLYQREVTSLSMSELVDGHRLREGYAPDEFTVRAVRGVIASQDEIDAKITRHATGWPLERIAPLERSILRLAVWEMASKETPAAVAIDEAVRLAKRYATEDAGTFVNGALGAIQREIEEAQ
ncbi:MAG: transcription antitermination factor NusB [Thermoleophilia bacterium]